MLEIAHLGLLPGDDPRIAATIDALTRHLGSGELLRRYVVDDGLPGSEGAFVACSFWRDPGTGAFLGNFPQALSHLALVRAALVLRDITVR